MPARRATDEAILAAVRDAGSVKRAAKSLGMARSSVQERLARLRNRVQGNDTELAFASERGLLGTEPVLPGYALKRTTAVYDKAGDLTRQYVTQAKAPGPLAEIPAGHVVKGVSILKDASGRVTQEWVKTREADGDPTLLAQTLRDVMLDARGASGIVLPPVDRDEDLLTVYVVSDLHRGMMAHGQECGEDYDLRIVSEMIRREVGRLMTMAPPSKHAVLLFLGDFFHQNDQKNATPRSGHALDVDGRWRKVYGVGARVAIGLSRAVAERHEEVEVAFLPGNHDEDAALTLAVALELHFEEHPRIRVAAGSGIHCTAGSAAASSEPRTATR